MGPKRVAVSQRVVIDPKHGEVRDCLDQEWAVWLNSLAIAPVAVPNRIADVAAFCDAFGIEAVFLSGGNNFPGKVYDDPKIEVADTAPDRDATEAALVDYAIERGIPLIGWCRGMQVLQVYFGGVLSSTSNNRVQHVAAEHDILFTSQLHASLANSPTIQVNSFHDFGVERSRLAKPLLEMAISVDDGVVEALYHPDLPIVGCQWHPERSNGTDGAGFSRALVHHLLFEGKSS